MLSPTPRAPAPGPLLPVVAASLLACAACHAPCTERSWYRDEDHDGWGGLMSNQTSCQQPAGHVDRGGDCDDTEDGVFPGAWELCDGLDNDCDGVVPEDESDADGDGLMPCDGDCDDADPDANLEDRDGDGFPSCPTEETGIGDCDDGDPAVFPGAAEACNGVDDDCDGDPDEIWIPDDALLPSGALDGAVDGVLLCIRAGTYVDTVSLYTVNAHLVGVDGAAATIIDAAGAGRVLGMTGGLSASTIVEGLTLTGGAGGDDYTTLGGGLFVEGSAPVLRDLVIEGNDGGAGAGGIHVYGGSPTIEGVTVRGNVGGAAGGVVVESGAVVTAADLRVEENAAAGGAPGGVLVEDADLALSSSLLEGNRAEDAAGGLAVVDDARVDLRHVVLRANVSQTAVGGLDVGEGAVADMDNVQIVFNEARDAGVGGMTAAFDSGATLSHGLIASNSGASDGGGLCVEPGAAPVLTSTVIAGNVADGDGAGLQLQASSFPSLTNVAVVGNWALGDAVGGGLWLDAGASPTLINVVVWGNEASSGGGIANAGGSIQAYASSLEGNVPDDIAGATWPAGSDGNLVADPRFLDTSSLDALDWDLHLDPASDLVDAGFAAYADPDGGAGDMGAYGGTGAGGWDLDGDGYPSWWQPGPYDATTHAPQGWDCDDLDPDVYPGAGC